MLENPTTFVIGAGASYEFGMPLGKELILNIGNALSQFSKNSNQRGHAGDEIREACAMITPQDWGPLRDAAFSISNAALSGVVNSIDDYLESHNANSHIVKLGKLAIAREILAAEIKAKVNFSRHGPAAARDTWAVKLFAKMSENVAANTPERFAKNCRFIVFNYDRCLEHFFQQALTLRFGISPDEANKIVSEIEIVHPYGKVADIPPHGKRPDSNELPFGQEKYTDKLWDLSDRIKIYTERTEKNDTVLTTARRYVAQSERIVFLGFAFQKQNIEFIFNEMPPLLPEEKACFGTMMGMSNVNRQEIQKALEDKILIKPNFFGDESTGAANYIDSISYAL